MKPCIRTSQDQDLPEHSGVETCEVCNPGIHYHSCPECYEKYPCCMKCTLEYDLQDGDKKMGAHCICDQCESKQLDIDKYKTKEFWLRYNGFIK